MTALHFAVQKDHPAVVKMLLDAGADVDAKNQVRGGSGGWAIFERRRCCVRRQGCDILRSPVHRPG